MQHIAIMKKSWKLLPKILTKQKTIESRWYMNRSAPWNKIKQGEIVYFKDSGEPITIKAEVNKVLQFDNLNSNKIKQLLNKYYKEDGIEKNEIPKFYNILKNKKYCMLIFLENPKKIEPFHINKKGFGMMSAWICVNDVESIRIVCV